MQAALAAVRVGAAAPAGSRGRLLGRPARLPGPRAASTGLGDRLDRSASDSVSGSVVGGSIRSSRSRKAGTWSPIPCTGARAGRARSRAGSPGRGARLGGRRLRGARRLGGGRGLRSPAAAPGARCGGSARRSAARSRLRSPREREGSRAARGIAPRRQPSGLGMTGTGFFTSSSILARYFSSEGRQRVIDLPERPARPVRPMRWT